METVDQNSIPENSKSTASLDTKLRQVLNGKCRGRFTSRQLRKDNDGNFNTNCFLSEVVLGTPSKQVEEDEEEDPLVESRGREEDDEPTTSSHAIQANISKENKLNVNIIESQCNEVCACRMRKRNISKVDLVSESELEEETESKTEVDSESTEAKDTESDLERTMKRRQHAKGENAYQTDFLQEIARLLMFLIVSAGIFWFSVVQHFTHLGVSLLSSKRSRIILLVVAMVALGIFISFSLRKTPLDSEEVKEYREIPLPIRKTSCGCETNKINNWSLDDFKIKEWIVQNWDMARDFFVNSKFSEWLKNWNIFSSHKIQEAVKPRVTYKRKFILHKTAQ